MAIDILVIGRNEGTCSYVSRVLSGHGFWVRSVKNSPRLLERVIGRTYGLVLVDQKTQPHGGFEIAAKLRKEPLLRDTPIIVLTGDGGEEMDEATRSAGATAWLRKPVSSEALLAAVRQHTQQAA